MIPSCQDRPLRRMDRILANTGVVLTAYWLLAFVLPVAQRLFLDMAFSMLISLLVAVLLWQCARRDTGHRRFWALLAAGWMVALLGSLVWGVYEFVTGQQLPLLSLVDGFYLIRYVLVTIAFWPVLIQPTRQQWTGLSLVLLTAIVTTAAVILLAPVAPADSLIQVLSGVVYPILDVGLVYISFGAMQTHREGHLGQALTFLTIALALYAFANWFNFHGNAASSQCLLRLAAFLWPLSDIVAGAGALCRLRTLPSGD